MRKYLILLLCVLVSLVPIASRLPNFSPEITKSAQIEIEKAHAAEQAGVETEQLPTPTQAPAFVEEPTPTPEIEEKVEEEINPYLVHGVDFSHGGLTISFEEGGPKKDIETKLVSPVNLEIFSSLARAFKVGEGYGIVEPDHYGNLILTVHSSYYRNDPLEAEPLRFFLERWGKEGVHTVEKNLIELEGAHGEIQMNGEVLTFTVNGALRVVADELNDDPALMLDIPEDVDTIGNLGILESAKAETENGSRKMIINFCGWGPEELPDWKRYSYYRYIIFIEIQKDNFN